MSEALLIRGARILDPSSGMDQTGDLRARIQTAYDTGSIDMGASIASDGVCLTVVALGPDWYDVQISAETISKTNIDGRGNHKGWFVGKRVNLERALKVGDELGGHFVFGHVDGVGQVVSVEPEGESYRLTIRPPEQIARYFATKGSAAVNGVSLTVAEALPNGDFELAIIPHTWEVTTLNQLQPGSSVNLEIDMLARYVARMIGADAPKG